MIDIANDLDLFKDEQVEITKRAKQVQEITVSDSEFSKSFTVPASAKNNAVFNYYANIDVDSTINPHKAIPAYWTIFLNTRYTGVLEVKGCVYKDGAPYSYSLVFYGRVKNLSTTFGEDRLTDVDWSSLDHTLNYDNIIDSWDGNLENGSLIYPLVDYERNMFLGDSEYNQDGNIRNISNGIKQGDLKPALRFRKMIQLIFENYGLSVSGTIDDSSIDNLYVQPNNRAGGLVNYEAFADNYVKVFGLNQEIPTNGDDIIIQMPNEVEDINNNWNGADTFTAPLSGSFTFLWEFLVSVSNVSTLFDFNAFVTVNGSEVFTSQWGSNVFDTVTGIQPVELDLVSGDTVQFGFREVDSAAPTMTVDRSKVTTNDLPSVETDVTMSLVDTMPNDKITDFLNSVLKAYRWIIVAGEYEGEWEILSEDDWRANGVKRDWSNYINLDSITYKKPVVYRSIRLTTVESESAVQTAFFGEQQRRFGEVMITPDVDFGGTDFVVESPFTPWTPSVFNVLGEDSIVLEQSLIPIYKMIDIEGSPTQDKYLMFYNEGLTGSLPDSQSYYLQDGSSGGDPTYTLMKTYPICGFSEGGIGVESTDNSSVYALEAPSSGDVPIETIYKKYWEDELYNIYANGARVCMASFDLPQDQFLSFDLSDTILCEGRRWHIDELRYNTLTGKAMATLSSKQPIKSRARVTSVDGSGKINFTGDPDAFVRSSVNAGAQLNGAYYLQTSKAALLSNKMKYTEAKADTFVTYITGITGDLIGWGDE